MPAGGNEGLGTSCSWLHRRRQRFVGLQSTGGDRGATCERFAARHEQGTAFGTGHHGRIGLLVGEPSAAKQQAQRRADDGTTQAETSMRRFHAVDATAKVGEESRTFRPARAGTI